MNHDAYADDYLRGVLGRVRVIAMVGASPKPDRPSHHVMRYLQANGFRVVPVNPGMAGQSILGEPCHASLGEIPVEIDMVDVFRNADAVPDIVEQAIRIGARVVWLQIGVRHDAAAARAEAAGLAMVMDRCPKIEHSRLLAGRG